MMGSWCPRRRASTKPDVSILLSAPALMVADLHAECYTPAQMAYKGKRDGGLVNRYGFSFSAFKTFAECPRRWWISKVVAWYGWQLSAPADRRLAYVLGKMNSAPEISGKIIHEYAAWLCRTEKNRRPAADVLLERYRNAMDEALVDSLSHGWESDPKRCVNLWEHYYRSEDAARAKISQVIDESSSAIPNLLESASLRRIDDGANLLSVEELVEFQIDGSLAWAQIDLGVRDSDGVVWITDWKTGKPRNDDAAQAGLYAVYCWRARDVEPARIRVCLEYLRPGTSAEYSYSEEELLGIKKAVTRATRTIRVRLPDPKVNTSSKDAFPMTENERVCSRCKLLHVCKGTRQV